MKAKKIKISMKEEIAIQEFLKGKTKTDSYLIAYPHTREWKKATVNNKASKLFMRPEIVARIEELTNRVGDQTVLNRTEFINKMIKAFRMALGELPQKKVDRSMGTITGTVEVEETDLKAVATIGKEIATLMMWYPREITKDTKEKVSTKIAIDKHTGAGKGKNKLAEATKKNYEKRKKSD